MIDLHCHILHGIDDGARSLDEAVRLCRIAVRNSIRTAVLTPHLVQPERVEEFVQVRDKRMAELKEAVEKENIPLELVSGAEVFVNDDIFYAPSLDAVTLGGSKYLLVEFSFNGLNINRLIKYMNEIVSRGYIPIIAHPERYSYIQQNYDIANHLADMGVLFQLNSSSLAGYGGIEVRELAYAMAASGMASFIGSDAHSVAHRPNNILEQREDFPTSIDFDVYEKLLAKNAQTVLEDGIIDRGRIYPIRRKKFF